MEVRKLEVAKIDRTTAVKMLEEHPYTRQRDINARQIEFYAEMMTAGEWKPFSDIEIAYAVNGDGTEHGYLINGQHRLYAVIESNSEVEFVVKHVVCDSQEEVGQRYGTVDVGRVRSPADYARSLALSEELGFKEYLINRLTSAVTAIHNEFKRSGHYNISTPQKFILVREYRKEARQYFTNTAGGVAVVTKQMNRSFPLAVALITLKESVAIYGEEKVKHFWSGIAFDNGLKTGDPRKLANYHFMQVALGMSAKGTRIEAPYTARFLANCFNAFVEDRELKQTRVDDALAPIIIYGTHFKGKDQ